MVTMRDIGVREYCGDCERHRVRRALVTAVKDMQVRWHKTVYAHISTPDMLITYHSFHCIH